MAFHASIVLVCLLLSSAAAAETIYKYRLPNGQMTYSNRLLRDAELIETFDYRFAPPAAPDRSAPKAAAKADENMKVHLARLDKAWAEVQAATRALAIAEARQAAASDAPLPGETGAFAGPPAAALPPPAVGGPQPLAAPAAGGPAPAASPAVGGPMGTQRGGRRNGEYLQRMAVLDADVFDARARLDAALKAYNQLR